MQVKIVGLRCCLYTTNQIYWHILMDVICRYCLLHLVSGSVYGFSCLLLPWVRLPQKCARNNVHKIFDWFWSRDKYQMPFMLARAGFRPAGPLGRLSCVGGGGPISWKIIFLWKRSYWVQKNVNLRNVGSGAAPLPHISRMYFFLWSVYLSSFNTTCWICCSLGDRCKNCSYLAKSIKVS